MLRGSTLSQPGPGGGQAPTLPVEVQIHYHGWKPSYDEWLPGAGTPAQHGLTSKTMALITSDCGAPRSLKHQMALIASGCCVPSSAELIGRLRLAGHDAWQRAGVDSSDRNGSRPEGPGQPEGGRGALTLEGGVYNAAYADPSQPEGFESAAGRKDLYAL